MTMFLRLALCLSLISFLSEINCETRVAVAYLATVSGSVYFTETESDNGLVVSGTFQELPEGTYRFQVHELGDISTCDDTGAEFIPDITNRGGRDLEVRYVRDLGKVKFEKSVDFELWYPGLSLRGRNSILGRALVLHPVTDDLGLGGHEALLTTSKTGARFTCGVIGIKSPADPWNSAASTTPSIMLMAAAFIFFIVEF